MKSRTGRLHKPVHNQLGGKHASPNMRRLKRARQYAKPDGEARHHLDADSSTEQSMDNLRGTAIHLQSHLASSMGGTLGTDLRDVSVYPRSPLPQRWGAWALTRGSEIHFAPGKYAPGSEAGRNLLAHELTHVAQQKGTRPTLGASLEPWRIHQDPTQEKEADCIGEKLANQARHKPQSLDWGAPKTKWKAPGLCRSSLLAQQNALPKGIAQAYFPKDGYSVANDITLAVKDGGQDLYAEDQRTAKSNEALEKVGSDIELVQGTDQITIQTGKKKTPVLTPLFKVSPKLRGVEGALKIWADCGKAAQSIMGGGGKQAITKESGDNVPVHDGTPIETKIEVMKRWWEQQRDAATTPEIKAEATEVLGDAQLLLGQITSLTSKLELLNSPFATTQNEGEKSLLYEQIVDIQYKLATVLWKKHDDNIDGGADKFDRNMGINTYAAPEVGQGYMIVSSNHHPKDKQLAGFPASRYNFHFGAVIMQSRDGADQVTLENFTVNDPQDINAKWKIRIYERLSGKNSFHDKNANETYTVPDPQTGDRPQVQGTQSSKKYGMDPTTFIVKGI